MYRFVNHISCLISGEMDDVLDNICHIHDCGSVYRHVSMLVSVLRQCRWKAVSLLTNECLSHNIF